jgi:hypothetical protein
VPTDAFALRGVLRALLLPSVAILTAPTRLEINAGTSLTTSLAAVGGFAVENQVREVAPVGASFVEQSPGINKAPPCVLTLYEAKTSATLRAAVAIGTSGYILLVPYGDVVGRRCELWPGSVATLATTWDASGAAVFRLVWAVRTAPTLNAVMPA